MTIMVTGATGTIGSLVIERLVECDVAIKALVREASKARLHGKVAPVVGDMLDPPAMRRALHGVDTLFLLNAVAADEVTQALITLDLARDVGIRRIVYFSVLDSATFVNVPHFAGKRIIEKVIDGHEERAAEMMPAWQAHDLRVMLQAFHQHGMVPETDVQAVLEGVIGHPLRRYRAFAEERAASW